jgi:hypothetical protein
VGAAPAPPGRRPRRGRLRRAPRRGFDFYRTENVALSADAIYTLGTGDARDYRYLSIGWGFTYRFGGGESGSAPDDEEDQADEGWKIFTLPLMMLSSALYRPLVRES